MNEKIKYLLRHIDSKYNFASTTLDFYAGMLLRLPLHLAGQIFEEIETNKTTTKLGDHVLGLLKEKGIPSQEIMSQMSPNYLFNGQEVTGAITGISSLIALTAVSLKYLVNDLGNYPEGYSGFVTDLIFLHQIPPLSAAAVKLGQQVAAPIANHDTREGLKHFLEIEYR